MTAAVRWGMRQPRDPDGNVALPYAKNMTTAPPPPENAGPAGERLWRNTLSEYTLSGADLEILRQCVLMADELADLEPLVRRLGPIIKDRDGLPVASPASVQHRLLSIAYGRLLACIRVIADVAEDTDPLAGRRPQHRSGVRGTYQLRAAE